LGHVSGSKSVSQMEKLGGDLGHVSGHVSGSKSVLEMEKLGGDLGVIWGDFHFLDRPVSR